MRSLAKYFGFYWRKKMKKITKFLALGAMFAFGTAGAFSAEKKSIVCTTFPQYDWCREILGDKAKDFDLTLLLDKGTDLHSFQPSFSDIAKISASDMFIYVGGESDGWVSGVLKEAKNKNLVPINMMEVLGERVKEEEVVEGMQETEHNHGEEGHPHDHGKEVSTFEDIEVKSRNLSDWAGEWQSAYPLVLDGTLDEAFEEKAESGKMTAEEYKAYYQKGYKTDISKISIKKDKIEFTYADGRKVSSKYKNVGFYIQNWSTGTKAAMYRFVAKNKKSGAPLFIEFNDHMIESAAAEHFHIRMSNESFDAIVDPENSFPTFFPASMSGEEICEHLAGHGHSHDEDGNEHGHHHEHDEVEYDEHVWLSVKNAAVLTNAIASQIEKLDPENASVYAANAKNYVEKLNALDKKYSETVASSKFKTILFGDRFPFRYLADDYGLKYYAAFVGCSAESEASFETVIFLAKKVDELGLGSVLTIENSNGKIARTVIQNTSKKNQKVLKMDSLQSVNQKDIKGGKNYLGTMTENLSVLKEALN